MKLKIEFTKENLEEIVNHRDNLLKYKNSDYKLKDSEPTYSLVFLDELINVMEDTVDCEEDSSEPLVNKRI